VAGLHPTLRADVRVYAGVAVRDPHIERHAPDFNGEDFDRRRSDRGNKTTAISRTGDGRVAIFAPASTRLSRGTILGFCAVFSERLFSAGAQGIGDMRQVNSFLRSASSRIGRRFAQIVAIAAASLPAAGA
jgi:hypothetical protein